MAVQVVFYDQMSTIVQFVLSAFVKDINVVTGVVLAAFLAHGKENRIVILLGAEGALPRIVVPFLQEQHAGFGAGVGLEGVAV